MRKITTNIISALLVLITLDIAIVMIGLAQVGIEGRTGHWTPFFYVQAKFVINLLT